MRKSSRLISGFILSLGLFAGASSAQEAPLPEPGEVPGQACLDFLATDIPAYYRQGYVTVPEDWGDPGGRKIRVFYYGNIEDETQTPIIYFNGGPGQDSHSSSGRFQTVEAAKTKTIIFMDQRGTGCSSPYPAELTAAAASRLVHYGSRSIVKDAEAVRKELFGDKKWKVFSQSYGGLIAHRYAAVAPGGLDGIYVHGFAVMSSWGELYKLRMLSQKRIAENYFSKAPGDRRRLEQIKAQIADDTCFQGDNTRVCGAGVIDSLSLMLGLPSQWGQIHGLIGSLLDADGKLKSAALRAYAEGMIRGNLDQTSMPGALITRIEMNDRVQQNQCAAALGLLRKEGYDLADWPLNECRFFASLSSLSQTDAVVEVINGVTAFDPLTLEDVAAGLRRNPELKIHLYSGGLDAYAPLEIFKEESQVLGPAVTYKNLPDTGHDGYWMETEIWDDLGK